MDRHYNLIELACLKCSKYQVYLIQEVKGLSQDLETRCPKLAIVKFWGVLFLRETINMYLWAYTITWELY